MESPSVVLYSQELSKKTKEDVSFLILSNVAAVLCGGSALISCVSLPHLAKPPPSDKLLSCSMYETLLAGVSFLFLSYSGEDLKLCRSQLRLLRSHLFPPSF